MGETRGVAVGVADPGLKKVSSPSPRSAVTPPESGRSIGLVGALVLALLGRPFTKCCNCCPTDVGSSATESSDSEKYLYLVIKIRINFQVECFFFFFQSPSADFGKFGKRSGISSADKPSTESTTDFGRSFRPCKLLRLVDRCGVACGKVT